MNINATLIVQAGNFFIAYLLFRYLFLGNAYEEMAAQKAHHDALEDTVAHDKRSVEKERERQREAWRAFANWCAEYVPRLSERASFFRGISPSIALKPIPDKQESAVRKKMVTVMMEHFKERYE